MLLIAMLEQDLRQEVFYLSGTEKQTTKPTERKTAHEIALTELLSTSHYVNIIIILCKLGFNLVSVISIKLKLKYSKYTQDPLMHTHLHAHTQTYTIGYSTSITTRSSNC